MAGDGNKPNFRLIAKLTSDRDDRWETIGVAWGKRDEDGRAQLSIKINPFVDAARLGKAEALMLVQNEAPRRREGGSSSGGNRAPRNDNDAPPDFGDDDIPF